MDRREFFRRAISKTSEVVVKEADSRIAARAQHWIRPPYALAELEFLLACTRCSDCIDACPEKIVFPLAARLGADVAGTPALDLLHKGCQMCNGWPCVQACESGALKLPEAEESESPPLPTLAYVSINTETCLPFQGPECGACVMACPVDGAMTLEQEKPVIHQDACTGCALCREACIVEDKAINVASVLAQMAE